MKRKSTFFITLLTFFSFQLIAQEYHVYETTQLKAFLSQENFGQPNGSWISSDYDKDSPATWGGITWTETNPKQVKKIDWREIRLLGILDINNFDYLDSLLLSNHRIDSISIKNIAALQLIDLGRSNQNDLKLNLEQLPGLKTFRANRSTIKSYDLSGCPALEEFSINNQTVLNELNFAHNKALKTLYFQQGLNMLYNIHVDSCAVLDSLVIKGGTLDFLDLSQNSGLRYFSVNDARLDSLILPAGSTLEVLNVMNNNIDTLDISALSGLTTFNCSGNNLGFNTLPKPADVSYLTEYIYSPQKNIPIGSNVNGTYWLHDSLAADLGVAYDDNTVFLWKDADSTGISSGITHLGQGIFDMGESLLGQAMFCESVHPDFPELVLFTNLFFSYNESVFGSEDVVKLREFLDMESIDPYGEAASNGLIISSTYLSEDPKTWKGVQWEEGSNLKVKSISWRNQRTISGPLNLEGFDKLESINIVACKKLYSINLTGCTNLEVIDVSECNLTMLDVSTFVKLESLILHGNNISALDLSNNPELTYLYCSANPLKTLQLSNNPKLEFLTIDYTKLNSLDLSGCPELRELDAYCNDLTSIDLSGCTKLERIRIFDNELQQIDISGNPNLEYLAIEQNPLTSLDVSNNHKLTHLSAGECELTSLDLSAIDSLGILHAGGNHLRYSTFTKPSVLTHSYCQGQSKLKTGFEVGEDAEITVRDTIDFSGEYLEGTTSYSWYRDGNSYYGVTNLGGGRFLIDSADYGRTFYCRIQNNSVGQLDLYSVDIHVKNDTLPYVYHPEEVAQLLDFLEQNSAIGGELNGNRVSDQYTSADPLSWGVTWNGDNPRRAKSIFWPDMDLAGSLNLSGFTELITVEAQNNSIRFVDVDSCIKLYTLNCFNNKLDSVSIENLENIEYLYVNDNNLTGLDVSNYRYFNFFQAQNNKLLYSTFQKDSYSYLGYYFRFFSQQPIVLGELVDETYSIYYQDTVNLSSEYDSAKTTFVWRYPGTGVAISSGVTDFGNGIFSFSESLIGETIYCEIYNYDFDDWEQHPALETVPVYIAAQQPDVTAPLYADISPVSVYPNPANEVLYIKIEEFDRNSAQHTVEIFNIMGMKVMEQVFYSSYTTLNISDISNSGLYLVRIMDNSGQVIKTQTQLIE